MADFDPYHEWLGISPEDRPITYYSLLSLRCFEPNAKVISNAVNCKMAFVKTFQTGPHSDEAQKILKLLSKASVILLNPEQKAKYDALLRKEQSARKVPVPPLKRTEPVVHSTPKRPEPTVKSVAKRPEPQASSLSGEPAQNINLDFEVIQKHNQNQNDSNDECEQILQVFNQKRMLASMIDASKAKLDNFESRWFGLLSIWHLWFPSEKYTKILQKLQKNIQDAKRLHKLCFLDISFFFTPLEREIWDSFINLIEDRGFFTWKILEEYDSEVHQAENGKYNVSNFELDKCSPSVWDLDFLHSSEPHITLGNKMGDSVYIYPSFIIIMNKYKCETIFHKDLEVDISKVYILSDVVPRDVKEIDIVWKYAKKDGGQDLRHKDNKKMFIQERFKLKINTKSNQIFSFLFDREDVANSFAEILKQHVKTSFHSPGIQEEFDNLKKQIGPFVAKEKQKSNSEYGCCGCLFLIIIIFFLLALIGSQGD